MTRQKGMGCPKCCYTVQKLGKKLKRKKYNGHTVYVMIEILSKQMQFLVSLRLEKRNVISKGRKKCQTKNLDEV